MEEDSEFDEEGVRGVFVSASMISADRPGILVSLCPSTVSMFIAVTKTSLRFPSESYFEYLKQVFEQPLLVGVRLLIGWAGVLPCFVSAYLGCFGALSCRSSTRKGREAYLLVLPCLVLACLVYVFGRCLSEFDEDGAKCVLIGASMVCVSLPIVFPTTGCMASCVCLGLAHYCSSIVVGGSVPLFCDAR